ncbi:polysaccharide biosynthesis protein [Thermaerobacillus caldiproteolyticus]|uniref:FlaA1/EpsC-like NDP-sugar epimerase n=1 Tax=Thermaerobacillus caldiproteolyticus TaxID=247480 RepID=A0A7W0BYG3_9BACL|nr:polysaccharide biosynthesis protein [Anoxybacillus caldiproteolyticus]MBA2873401.1 FlaA1/EpsC-like NDP-sugar epimerase [Anoxybacillus caldiproteolyticus]QPA29993.1 polysaccharide biosynthesis protein [Anoxybacillus caldiproteolyticus]
MFNNEVILVTGGTGSWGHELILQLLSLDPKKIIVFSRNEASQVQMRRVIEDPRLSFCIGDIRDREALVKAFEGVDYVFHLAALKHVPVCEEQPLEALKTNVIGTQNVIEAAIENGVKKVINISTDKAADPINFYGMTKAIGEKLIVYANQLSSDTKFISIRSGNILGSNGSVLHLFINQIKKKEIRITDKRMTRFFLTPQKAIQLLLKAANEGKGGEIFVMRSSACRILDLAEVLIEASGEKDVSIVEYGARPGEKLHEVLISDHESQNTVVYDEDFLIVLPEINIPGLKQAYSAHLPVKKGTYCSSDLLITKEEIKQLLIEGGFLT